MTANVLAPPDKNQLSKQHEFHCISSVILLIVADSSAKANQNHRLL